MRCVRDRSLFVASPLARQSSAVRAGAAPRRAAQEASPSSPTTHGTSFPPASRSRCRSARRRRPEVRLHYELAPDGTGASGVAQCNGSAHDELHVHAVERPRHLRHPRRRDHLPLGHRGHRRQQAFDARDAATSTRTRASTSTRSSDGNVTVYYHSGTEDEARGVLAAAVETLDRVERTRGDAGDVPGEGVPLRRPPRRCSPPLFRRRTRRADPG